MYKTIAFLTVLCTAVPAFAADPVDGQVTKVDASAKKLTIKHGEIKALDMPAMTMVFQVADTAFLTKVKAGDKVKFNIERMNGALTVTTIEKSK
ncbi:copper-binding protein [Prosthecodimorpha staleyi]|uniref:Copper-binding protein n=1 Tax=Prosthecodimorpha staleyi TaxID=2840188 RepID=A0A947D4W9_9HYPH|nr:copper-binding protein [Prosthecodimorpha staleyi]MBT9290896.1 copper-binding protein [Prosthecodimorpha staleyi]